MNLQTHPKHYEVLGLGAACIDLLIPVSDDFLSRVPGPQGGAEPIDIESLNRIIAQSGQEPYMATGGSCANAIKGLATLGIKCALLSRIGSDLLGDHFTHYMHQVGVTPLFIPTPLPTARVLCLIAPNGQRTMRFFTGSSEEMSEHDVQVEYFKGVRLVHMDAYSLRNGFLVERMWTLAKETGALVSMDLSSFEIVHVFKKRIEGLLEAGIDILFANQDEAEALTGRAPHESCLAMQRGGAIAVVLMGKKGCLVGHQGKVTHYPTTEAHVIDTTGAGDLFASGFLYGHLQGLPLKSCASIGNLLGGTVTEVMGTEIPPMRWKTIRQKIARMVALSP